MVDLVHLNETVDADVGAKEFYGIFLHEDDAETPLGPLHHFPSKEGRRLHR